MDSRQLCLSYGKLSLIAPIFELIQDSIIDIAPYPDPELGDEDLEDFTVNPLTG